MIHRINLVITQNLRKTKKKSILNLKRITQNVVVQMDQSVFTVLPSRPGIRPGMVLIFELFLLRGAVVATDRVVAWGAFPIADAKFDVVEGKYVATLILLTISQ